MTPRRKFSISDLRPEGGEGTGGGGEPLSEDERLRRAAHFWLGLWPEFFGPLIHLFDPPSKPEGGTTRGTGSKERT